MRYLSNIFIWNILSDMYVITFLFREISQHFAKNVVYVVRN